MRMMTKRPNACFVSLSFAGLVVLARSLNPIPSRTRPLNSSAPMVLWLKPWESRSLPGLPRTKQFLFTCHDQTKRRLPPAHGMRKGEAAFLFLGCSCVACTGAAKRLSGRGLPPPTTARNIVIRRSIASFSGAPIPLECIADSRAPAPKTIIFRSETSR